MLRVTKLCLYQKEQTLYQKSVLYKTNTNRDINSPMIINPEDNNETLSEESRFLFLSGKNKING